jgi:hypothetical protein
LLLFAETAKKQRLFPVRGLTGLVKKVTFRARGRGLTGEQSVEGQHGFCEKGHILFRDFSVENN